MMGLMNMYVHILLKCLSSDDSSDGSSLFAIDPGDGDVRINNTSNWKRLMQP